MKLKVLTVSEVNSYLKRLLDNDFVMNNISVKGEVSNLKFHSSGHVYFSLKDEDSKINCVMFREKAMNLDFLLENGMEIEVKAKLSIYLKEGTYQLYCKEIKKSGIGELFEKFQKLKEELEKEGLFDITHKKKIPAFPKRIGVVTAETGAAIRDIITVIRSKNKSSDIVLYPSLVQGQNAPSSIIEGIKYFNKTKSVDIVIIGRGGGSIEELWAFNDKNLAYEIYKSKLPIISAVGHEIDYTISDFVSDLRAATPSAAGEISVFSEEDLKYQIEANKNYLDSVLNNKLNTEKNRLASIEKLLKSKNPSNTIANNKIILDTLNKRLNQIININLEKQKSNVLGLNDMLMTLNPLNTLNRGYAVIKDENKNIIKSVKELEKTKKIEIILRDGSKEIDISLRGV